MGHAAVSQIDRALGSPFSLPGALVERAASGRALADYESLFMQRPFSRWTIRMGLDDRLFLEDGWSAPARRGEASYRSLLGASAGLAVALHRPLDYRLTLRAAVLGDAGAAGAAARVRAVVNQQALDACDFGPDWSECETLLPARVLRGGRNLLRLRLVALSPGARLAVAGASLEPRAAGP
jgi:hypothetical protein